MRFLLLDANEQIIDTPPAKHLLSLIQDLKLTGVDTVEAAVEASKRYTGVIDNVRYLAVSDRDNDHAFYLYRKTMAEVQSRELIIDGKDSFWDDLSGSYIKDKRPGPMLAPGLVKLILDGTRWEVDFVDSGFSEQLDTNFYYQARDAALSDVMSKMQLDVVPRINIEGNKITRRYVDLYLQAGGDNGRRFVYGKNALTVVKKTDDSTVYTALVGRGSSIEETVPADTGSSAATSSAASSAATADASAASTYNTPKITFADVVWSKANGDPVDKPKGQEYVEWPEATKLYGYSDGTPRIGFFDAENETDPAALLKETWAQLKATGLPSIQFSATVGGVGYLAKGETVTIVNYVQGMAYKTRVTELKWNRLSEAKSELTIGDKLVLNANERMTAISSQVAQAATATIKGQVANLTTLTDSLGVNVSWSLDGSLPKNPKEGDILYVRNSDGSITEKTYQDGQWVILVDDTTGEQIRKQVEAQQADIKAAKDAADSAVAQASAAVDASGLSKASASAASEAASAASALAAETAKDFADVQSQAASAASDAADAGVVAKAAQSDATAAVGTASKVLDTVGETTKTVTALSGSVDELTGTIKSLATQADLDKLAGTVTTTQTLAQQTAESLTAKADQSVVDTINKTVTEQGTKLALTATAAELSAAQKTIDTLSGTVAEQAATLKLTAKGADLSSLQTKVDTNTGAISKATGDISMLGDQLKVKLESADVSNMLNGYATQTYVGTTVDAKAGSLETKMSQITNGLGVKNYVYNSEFANTAEGWQKAPTPGFSIQSGFKLYKGSNGVGYKSTQMTNASWSWLQSKWVPAYTGQVWSASAVALLSKEYQSDPTIKVTQKAYIEIAAYDADKTTLHGAYQSNMFDLTDQFTPQLLVINGVKLPDKTAYVCLNLVLLGPGYPIFAQPTLNCAETVGAYQQDTIDTSAFNDLSLTVNGLSQTTAKQTSDLNTVSNKLDVTATGLSNVTAVTGINGEKVTALRSDVDKIQATMTGPTGVTTRLQTLEGFQQNATNDITGLQSTQTQLANQWTSTIGSPNIVYNSSFVDNLAGWTNKSGSSYSNGGWAGEAVGIDGIMVQSESAGWYGAESKKVPASENAVYSGSVKICVANWTYTPAAAYLEIVFYDSSGARITASDAYADTSEEKWRYVKKENLSAPKGTKFVSIILVMHNAGKVKFEQPILVQGASVGPYRPDSVSGSQITQLQSDINLRVQKGDLLSQINIQAGQTLIQSGKLYLDAPTVAFSGKAFIPSAAIADLSADKLTAGTINAANVRIINMDASAITTGQLSGNRIAANSITADKLAANSVLVGLNNSLSNVTITPNSFNINSTSGGQFSLSLNPNDGLVFKAGTTGIAGLHASDNHMDEYLQPAGQQMRWGYIVSGQEAHIMMTLNKSQTAGMIAGLQVGTNLQIMGDIYSRSATSSANGHVHFSEYTSSTGGGIQLVNDVPAGIQWRNDGTIWAVSGSQSKQLI